MRARSVAAGFLLYWLVTSLPATAQPARTVAVSAADYPNGVRPTSDHRYVRVRYRTAREGSVVACTVARSSGNAVLDAASCSILRERARLSGRSGALLFDWFPIASLEHDRNGRNAPLPIDFRALVTGGDYPAEALRRREGGNVRYTLQVSEAGAPLSCAITESSGVEALDRRTCEILMSRGAFIAASDGTGGRASAIFNGIMSWVPPEG